MKLSKNFKSNFLNTIRLSFFVLGDIDLIIRTFTGKFLFRVLAVGSSGNMLFGTDYEWLKYVFAIIHILLLVSLMYKTKKYPFPKWLVITSLCLIALMVPFVIWELLLHI